MSVSFKAYAVIGVKINPRLLFQNGLPVPGYDVENETLGGFGIYQGTDEQDAFVGFLGTGRNTSFRNDNQMIKLPSNLSIPDAEVVMQKLLEPLGLWDPKHFGLWSVLYCNH
jgi:hypothetical protein